MSSAPEVMYFTHLLSTSQRERGRKRGETITIEQQLGVWKKLWQKISQNESMLQIKKKLGVQRKDYSTKKKRLETSATGGRDVVSSTGGIRNKHVSVFVITVTAKFLHSNSNTT